MKLFVVLGWFCFVAEAIGAPYNARDAVTLRFNFNIIGLGNYKYDFETSNGIRQEQQGVLQNEGREDQFLTINGIYSWIAPNGVRYIVTYKADDQGYNSEIEEEPGALPPAVQASLIG